MVTPIHSYFKKQSKNTDVDTNAFIQEKLNNITNSHPEIDPKIIELENQCQLYRSQAELAEKKLKHAQAALKKAASVG